MPARALRVAAVANLRKAKKMLALCGTGMTDASAATGGDDRAGKIASRVTERVLEHTLNAARILVFKASESVIAAFIDDMRLDATCDHKKRGLCLDRLPLHEYHGHNGHFLDMREWQGDSSRATEKAGPRGVRTPTFDVSTLKLTLEIYGFGTVCINMPRNGVGELDVDGDVTASTIPW